MTAATPRVSVLIPTHNRAVLLGESIRSVLRQSFHDFEIIVVDDGSSDNTGEAVRGFGDPRIRYVRFEKASGGCTAPRNAGLKVAQGEYIACLDDDDEWSDAEKLTTQVAFLDSHQDYVLVGTSTTDDRTSPSLTDEDLRPRMLQKNSFIHSGVMYRKSAALVLGGYRNVPGTPYCDDYELWLKLGTVGKVAIAPIRGVKYCNLSRTIVNRSRVIFAFSDLLLLYHYGPKYPNYVKGLAVQLLRSLRVSLHLMANVPPAVYVKDFVRRFHR